MLEEFNGFKILAPAELIWQPFSLFPRIIQVEHRSHRIDAQTIDVKPVAPEERVGGKKVPHFVTAIIENQCPPILMSALARIFVLVKRGPVKSSQSPVIARK